MRERDVVVASPSVPVAAAQPGGIHVHHNAAVGRHEVGHLPNLKWLTDAVHHHRAHIAYLSDQDVQWSELGVVPQV